MKPVIDLLENFKPASDEERIFQQQILQFVRANPDNCLLRSNLIAHVTASAWVIDRELRNRALLVHHVKLGRWLQPGGHADGDSDLLQVALKEVEEETGVTISDRPQDIFDLDVHLIPFHKDVPPHLHLDVRFLFMADSSFPLTVSAESHAVRWIEFSEIPMLGVDQSVLRLLRKSENLSDRSLRQ